MPISKRSISAKNWHAKKSSEASLQSQVASAFQLVKKATLEPLASWPLVRRLRLCSRVVWPRLLVLTQTAPQALCLTITRRQRHHGQSISRWSLYQARRHRTRLFCARISIMSWYITLFWAMFFVSIVAASPFFFFFFFLGYRGIVQLLLFMLNRVWWLAKLD